MIATGRTYLPELPMEHKPYHDRMEYSGIRNAPIAEGMTILFRLDEVLFWVERAGWGDRDAERRCELLLLAVM